MADTNAVLDTSPSGPLNLHSETDLSPLYRVLRTVIKPFRPRLVKPGSPQPAGSPRLTRHPKNKNGITITERQHKPSGLWLYDFTLASPRGIKVKPPSHIYYFAGGAFQSPPASQHWSFLSKLANELVLEHHITLVSYPLAPNSPASTSLPVLREFLREVTQDAARRGESVTLMGDSAGGNVALSLGFWWAGEVSALANESLLKATLRSIVLVSPAVDLRNSNPAIAEIDPVDPLLGASYTGSVARAWLAAPPGSREGGLAADDPHASPLLHEPASYRVLADLGIGVHGIYGTHDVLAPDTELFRHKCEEVGIQGRWLVWVGQMHCFVLTGTYGMKEGKEGIRWLIDVLKSNQAPSSRP